MRSSASRPATAEPAGQHPRRRRGAGLEFVLGELGAHLAAAGTVLVPCLSRLDRIELGLDDGAAVEQLLGLLDLGGRAARPRHRADVVVELRLAGPGRIYVAVAEFLTVRDQLANTPRNGTTITTASTRPCPNSRCRACERHRRGPLAALEHLEHERTTVAPNKFYARRPADPRELQQRLRERRLHRTVAIPHDDQLAAMVETGTYEHDALARTTRMASSGPGSRSHNA